MNKQSRVISEKQAFARMARLCSQKEYCSFDISQKLYRLNLSAQEIERVISLLIKQNFINDERFVRSYIGDKVKFNKWGKRKIELSLRQKKLPETVIQRVFCEYSDSELNHSLEDILNKKWRSVKGANDNERKSKLIRYALGRGFEMKEIIAVMRKLNLEITDED
ncbi:MAG: regulatory protein RecX [Fermentimonas sp.]|nr:regulatory protein RecX [Fermentimonas sp.]